MYVTTVEIDKMKLIRELNKRNLTMAMVSKGCGFSENYLNQNTSPQVMERRGGAFIAQSCMYLLYEKYNIRPESILKEKEEPKTEEKKPEAVIDPNELYKLIKKAMIDAEKELIEIRMDAMCKAMKKALEGEE